MEVQPRAAIISLVGRLLDGEQIHVDEVDQLPEEMRSPTTLPRHLARGAVAVRIEIPVRAIPG